VSLAKTSNQLSLVAGVMLTETKPEVSISQKQTSSPVVPLCSSGTLVMSPISFGEDAHMVVSHGVK
jgi:hypothetical protein